LEHTTVAVEDGGTTIVCRGGDELLKLRQPARLSGRSRTSAMVLIE
jgi:hypothetical protein